MKKKKVLFIAPLPNKKFNFDGERNKSRDVLLSLKKTNKYKINIINLSNNKFFAVIRMLFLYLFKKYDYVFISKCIVGGSLALHLINKIRINPNVYFYIIGNGYYGLDEKKIYFSDIQKCKHLIVESQEVKESMVKKGCKSEKMSIFPCLKPTYDIDVLHLDYKTKRPLRLLYFSRINPEKGLGDLIDTIIKINSEHKSPIFYLDISGGVSNEPGIAEFNKEVISKCDSYDFLNYLGMSLRIDGIDSYKQIQNYDLHVFPSHFKQECAPGSILDMFVAGIPTLSSKFPSYKTIINEENSILFEQNNIKDLYDKLMYCYDNAEKILNKKRDLSHEEYFKYTDDAFIKFLNSIEFN